MDDLKFKDRYGPWALVAGASAGIGAEFSKQLAAKGLNVVCVARGREKLENHALEIARNYGVDARPVAADLGGLDAVEQLRSETAGLEIGLLVYNAAYSPIGPFLDQKLEDKLKTLYVNCRGLLMMAHEYGKTMAERGRGGMIFMSSLAGMQGNALVAGYAASKAYGRILGESLWDELREHGVDVLAFSAGATRTPGYEATLPEKGGVPSYLVQEPEAVATEALAVLGKGPSRISGTANKLTANVFQRLLPRRLAASTMGRMMRKIYGRKEKS
ncbi:MAG: SDR family NAD(P)-dependent oxidoreductase [Pseudomonadota bacterium]